MIGVVVEGNSCFAPDRGTAGRPHVPAAMLRKLRRRASPPPGPADPSVHRADGKACSVSPAPGGSVLLRGLVHARTDWRLLRRPPVGDPEEAPSRISR